MASRMSARRDFEDTRHLRVFRALGSRIFEDTGFEFRADCFLSDGAASEQLHNSPQALSPVSEPVSVDWGLVP